MNPAVAVIDIGSNSIKVLVAARAATGGLDIRLTRTLDVRISAGISRQAPRLSEDSMARGLEAVRTLLTDAARFQPVSTALVATSAVRDAQNGPEFRARVQAATGHAIRILTGDEEANLIGRGLTCDRALAHLRDFYVFDLGGGSLECLAFRQRRVSQAASLQLGCVRLSEVFLPNTSAPFPMDASAAIQHHTREVIARSGFAFSLPAGSPAVGLGGTVTVSRAVLAARAGIAYEATPPRVTVAQLRELLASFGALALAERQRIAGLPPARADVYPTALATLIAVAEAGNFDAFQHSLYNLRYGLADELLAGIRQG